MKFKFEKLVIWQKAMEMGEEINLLSGKFPKKEIYNLSSQIMRAVDSIALNISEGSIGQSNPEIKKFMGYAIRSQAEVVTCLYKAKYRNYISEEEFQKVYDDSYNLMNMMVAFKKKYKMNNLGSAIFGPPTSDFYYTNLRRKNYWTSVYSLTFKSLFICQ